MTKKALKEKLQRVLKERTSQRGLVSSNKLQMENNIQNPLALAFDKLGHLYVSTKQGEVFEVKVKSDLVSLKGEVIAQISLDCGHLYGMTIVSDQLYTDSHGDEGGIFAVDLGNKKFEKVVKNGTSSCSRVDSLTEYNGKVLSFL